MLSCFATRTQCACWRQGVMTHWCLAIQLDVSPYGGFKICVVGEHSSCLPMYVSMLSVLASFTQAASWQNGRGMCGSIQNLYGCNDGWEDHWQTASNQAQG